MSTATPKRAMNPTPAEILKGSPRTHKAAIPPISDNGTVVKTTSEYVMLRKAKKSSRSMSMRAMGITTDSVRMAFCRFSNCPPYSK